MEDHVDRVVREWREVRPDLDLSAVEVVARIERAGRLLEREVASTLSRYGLTRGGFAVLSALRRQAALIGCGREISCGVCSARPAL